MAETSADSQDLQEQVAAEQQLLSELDDCIQALDILQRAFIGLTTAEERSVAEGRRCALVITGLKHSAPLVYLFVVRDSAIQLVSGTFTPSYVQAALDSREINTSIAAPMTTVIRALRAILAGRDDAFSKEWARGQAEIRGQKSFHDAVVFNEGFRRLARVIKRYKTG